MICRYAKKSFIEIPLCAKKVIFITEFAYWCKNTLLYEVKKIFQKRPCTWRNFKINLSRPLFIIMMVHISFWPGTQKLNQWCIAILFSILFYFISPELQSVDDPWILSNIVKMMNALYIFIDIMLNQCS